MHNRVVQHRWAHCPTTLGKLALKREAISPEPSNHLGLGRLLAPLLPGCGVADARRRNMAAGCQAGSAHRSLLRAWSVKLQTHPRAKARATPRGCNGRSPPGPAAALNRSQGARGETEIPPSPSPQSQEALRNVGPPPRLAAQPPIHHGSSALQGDTGSSRGTRAGQTPLHNTRRQERRRAPGSLRSPPAGAPPGGKSRSPPAAAGRRGCPSGRAGPDGAPPPARAEPAGTCSPRRAGSRGREGGAHYKSQGALRRLPGVWSKLPFP